MVTTEQLRTLAPETVSNSTLTDLIKEFEHLDHKRARHVCRYIVRHLGLSDDFVRDIYHEATYGYYFDRGDWTAKTIFVHPDKGIVFISLGELNGDGDDEDDEMFDDEEEAEFIDESDPTTNQGTN